MNVLFTAGKFYATDNNGLPAVGYKVWAYASPDTSTPATTYSNQECTVANTWPVVLDARGEAFIYIKAETDFYLTIPTAIDISSVIWESRKVGEQQNAPLYGTATADTHNNYTLNITPAPLALTNNLMVIWTPPVDSKETIGATVFTGTGINDGVFTGPYIGSTPGSVFTAQIDSVAVGIDSYIKLLLHGDGSGATFVDSETTPKTVTAHGDVTQSDVQYKFGGKSILLDGTGDYLSLLDSVDWYLSSSGFTIDFWVRFTAVTDATFVAQHQNASNTFYLDYVVSTHKIRFYFRDAGVDRANYDYAWTPVVDTWYHIELVRNGTNLYLFINGTKITWSTITTAISTNALGDITGLLTIGYGLNIGTYFAGYIDEFCWSKGIARHTADFAAPTQAYLTGGADTIRWKKNGGAWTSLVPITAAKQILYEDVAITFAETIGHTYNDIWTTTVETPARLNLPTVAAPSNSLLIYKNVAGTLQALAGGDIKANIPATCVYSLTQNCYILNNPSTAAGVTVSIPQRIRKELTGEYTVVLADQGTDLSCSGTFPLHMAACPSVPNSFFYVMNKGSGFITIDCPSYVFYGLQGSNSVSSFVLGPGLAVQLETNGVDYQVLAMTYGVYRQIITNQSSVTYTGLIPGVRYKLVFDLLQNTADAAHLIRFNGDSGANYSTTNLLFYDTVVSCNVSASAWIQVTSTVVATYAFSGEIEFNTVYGNNKKVIIGGSTRVEGAVPSGIIINGKYTGAADLVSMVLSADAGTMSGTLTLYQYG